MNKNVCMIIILMGLLVGSHFLFRDNTIIEGNTTQGEVTNSTNDETTNDETTNDETTNDETTCKAVVDNSIHNGLCDKQSYKNSDVNSGCSVYTGKNDGDIQCYANCCDLKSEQDLDNNKRFASFQKEVHGCQDARNYSDSLVCKAIDNLAESRLANNTLSEESSVSDFNPDVDETTQVDNNGETLATQNNTNASETNSSSTNANAQCSTETTPDRASSYTREANVSTGFFTSRPSGWPFASNSSSYDNHLTGCNCPPCDKYKNPGQVL